MFIWAHGERKCLILSVDLLHLQKSFKSLLPPHKKNNVFVNINKENSSHSTNSSKKSKTNDKNNRHSMQANSSCKAKTTTNSYLLTKITKPRSVKIIET